MRLLLRVCLPIFIFIFSAFASILDQTHVSISLPLDASGKIVERNKWFAGLSREILAFRLSANSSICITDTQPVDYRVDQRYEIRKDGSIAYLIEVKSKLSEQVVFLEKNIPADSVASHMDEAAKWLYNKLGLDPSLKHKRFFRIPVIVQSPKEIQQFGELIVRCEYDSSDTTVDPPTEYMKHLNKDARNILANYLAARSYEEAGDLKRAGDLYKDLVSIIPNHQGLYEEATRILRVSSRYTEALTMATAGEDKGVYTVGLMLNGALSLEALHKTYRARKVFEVLYEYDSTNIPTLLFFARDFNNQGKQDEALKYIKKIVAIEPDNGKAVYELGKFYILKKNYTKAVEMLEKSLKLLSDDLSIRYLLGEAHWALKNYEKAAINYECALLKNLRNYSYHKKTSDAFEAAGKTKDLHRVMKRAEALFPDSLVIQKRIGLAAYTLGDTTSSKLHLERYLKYGEKDAEVLMILGDIYTKEKKYERAFYMFNHALPLVSDDTKPKFAIAKLYVEKKDSHAAIPILKEVLEIHQEPKVYRLLGDAWYDIGYTREALEAYLTNRELGQNDTTMQTRIARIYYSKKDLKKAKREYERLMDFDNRNPEACFHIAVMWLKDGNVVKAEEYIKKGKERGDPNRDLSYAIGLGFDECGEPQKALQFYYNATEYDSSYVDAYVKMAAVYKKLGILKSQAEMYEKLFSLQPTDFLGKLAEAGTLYEKIGQKDKAKNAYKRSLMKGYKDPNIRLKYGRILYVENDIRGAFDALRMLPDKEMHKKEDASMMGVIYYKLGNYQSASHWLKIASDQDKKNIHLIKLLAESYENIKNYDFAIETRKVQLRLSKTQDLPDLAYHIGGLIEKKEDMHAAGKWYKNNIEAYPNDIRNYECLIDIYMKEDKLNGARDILELAVYKHKKEARLIKLLADVCLQQNDKYAAILNYKKYLKINEDDFSAWYNLGEIYYAKKIFPKSAMCFFNASRLRPGDFVSQYKLGMSYARSNEYNKAVEALDAAHNINPKDVVPLEPLAKCYDRMNDTLRFTMVLKKIANIESSNLLVRQQLGEIYLKSEKYEKAKIVLDEACSIREEDAEIHMLAARAYDGLGDNKGRYIHIMRAFELDSSNSDINFEVANFYADTQDITLAKRHYTRAVEENQDNHEAAYRLSQILYKEKDYKRGYEIMKRVIDRDLFTVKYLILFSRYSYELLNLTLAIEMIERAIDLDKNSVEARAFGGYLYLREGSTDLAEKTLQDALALDEKCDEAFVNLGNIEYMRTNYQIAASYYSRAIKIRGYEEDLALLLGKSFNLCGELTKAEGMYLDILENNPDQNEALYRLSHLYSRDGRMEKAKDLIDKCKKEEKTVWYHLAIGDMFEIRGDIQNAQISFQVALRLNNSISEAHRGLGRTFLAEKKYEEAIRSFGQAQTSDPYNPYLLLDLARGYEGIGEDSSAKEIYMEMLEKYPKISEVYLRLAEAETARGENLRAISLVKEGLSYNKRHAALYMMLGDLYDRVDLHKESIEAYQNAFKHGDGRYNEALHKIAVIYKDRLGQDKDAKKYQKKYERLN